MLETAAGQMSGSSGYKENDPRRENDSYQEFRAKHMPQATIDYLEAIKRQVSIPLILNL